MKMNFIFGNFFWGLFFILLGLSVFLKAFNIYLPLVRVLIAILIIMFGIKLLFGIKYRHYHKPKPDAKENSIIYSSSRNEYSIIFSSGVIDFSDLPENAKDIEINVVFGSGTVILPDSLAVNINPTSIFGATILPPKMTIAQENPVEIESTVVFGRLEYKYAKAKQTKEQPTEPQ